MTVEDLKKALDDLRDEYDGFQTKAFAALIDRVFILEKKVTNLYSRGSEMDVHNEGNGGVVDGGELGERVTSLEE